MITHAGLIDKNNINDLLKDMKDSLKEIEARETPKEVRSYKLKRFKFDEKTANRILKRREKDIKRKVFTDHKMKILPSFNPQKISKLDLTKYSGKPSKLVQEDNITRIERLGQEKNSSQDRV
eukprot:CAMPEP_0114977308 /NCGR_PEP_ID=MMETSP0216-20121206/3165_1 /TAXON_ID=223996 /ORGANISM="Protocruzia adherens, Strain Boccale" /LENGTH=121 /DNA_ID=CAMNT_0002338351 /DNA_START=170 /DNA_END=532 /DNA_ORIENTATION=-